MVEKRKRGYSREFTPRTERRVTITIDKVPPTLKDAAQAKAKREGVSLRAKILTLLKAWVDEPAGFYCEPCDSRHALEATVRAHASLPPLPRK